MKERGREAGKEEETDGQKEGGGEGGREGGGEGGREGVMDTEVKLRQAKGRDARTFQQVVRFCWFFTKYQH